MLNKVELDCSIWSEFGADEVPILLKKFFENPDINSQYFRALLDQMSDSLVCKPTLFLTIPHLIEFASTNPFAKMIDVWCHIGICIACATEYKGNIPSSILDLYNCAINYAEKIYPNILVSNQNLLCPKGHYLFSALFGFARHDLGKIGLGNFFANDSVGESIVFCKNGHENDVIIFSDTTIAPIEKYKRKYKTAPVYNADTQVIISTRNPNPWEIFVDPLKGMLLSMDIPCEIKTHIQVAIKVAECGVSPQIPMKCAFSLLGSLLYWCGMKQFALRAFHSWDTICCEVCGEPFCFADQWGKLV